MNPEQRSQFIKSVALQLGFDFCGIAKAGKLDEDARRLEKWLKTGMHGSMSYMERHFDLRTDPSLLVTGAKSVITLLFNYFPESTTHPRLKISKYAWGEDYHDVIRTKLREFFAIIKDKLGDINGRGFVDSAPVLERAWAVKSGLGWIGKNGNLINKRQGSFFFIASLISDLELEVDTPFETDHCGTCTRCIEACPTDAILPDKVIDGSKCISYFTIELKDALIPNEMKNRFENWVFGCDTCQDVCPWNRFSQPHREEKFKPISELLSYSESDWEALTTEKFKLIFGNSAITRTGLKGIQRNIHFVKNHDHE